MRSPEVRHSFDTSVAKLVGVQCAVIYANIEYWTEINEENGRNFKDGHYWVYYSAAQLTEKFSYLTEKQIWRALKNLVDAGFLETGNFNKHKNDRTKWYRVTKRSDQTVRPNGQTKRGEASHRLVESSDQTVRPLPDTNPNTNPDTNTHPARAFALNNIPEPIRETVRRYLDQVDHKANLARCQVYAEAAVAELGAETVNNGLQQAIDEVKNNSVEQRYQVRNLQSFFANISGISRRAALYKPTTPHPETGPPQPETVAWLKAMSDAERRAEFAEAQRLGQTWPEEVLRIWPESQSKLTQTA